MRARLHGEAQASARHDALAASLADARAASAAAVDDTALTLSAAIMSVAREDAAGRARLGAELSLARERHAAVERARDISLGRLAQALDGAVSAVRSEWAAEAERRSLQLRSTEERVADSALSTVLSKVREAEARLGAQIGAVDAHVEVRAVVDALVSTVEHDAIAAEIAATRAGASASARHAVAQLADETAAIRSWLERTERDVLDVGVRADAARAETADETSVLGDALGSLRAALHAEVDALRTALLETRDAAERADLALAAALSEAEARLIGAADEARAQDARAADANVARALVSVERQLQAVEVTARADCRALGAQLEDGEVVGAIVRSLVDRVADSDAMIAQRKSTALAARAAEAGASAAMEAKAAMRRAGVVEGALAGLAAGGGELRADFDAKLARATDAATAAVQQLARALADESAARAAEDARLDGLARGAAERADVLATVDGLVGAVSREGAASDADELRRLADAVSEHGGVVAAQRAALSALAARVDEAEGAAAGRADAAARAAVEARATDLDAMRERLDAIEAAVGKAKDEAEAATAAALAELRDVERKTMHALEEQALALERAAELVAAPAADGGASSAEPRAPADGRVGALAARMEAIAAQVGTLAEILAAMRTAAPAADGASDDAAGALAASTELRLSRGEAALMELADRIAQLADGRAADARPNDDLTHDDLTLVQVRRTRAAPRAGAVRSRGAVSRRGLAASRSGLSLIHI